MNKALVLLALPVLAGFTTPRVVHWSSPKVQHTPTKIVGQAVIRVKADIANGWHVYALNQTRGGPKALSFALEGSPAYSLGPVSAPKARRAYDQEFKIATDTYSGSPEFFIPLTWTAAAGSRRADLRLVVRYQACSDKLCLPPEKEALSFTVTP